MSMRTVGTCSLCGGVVTVPDPWMGVTPPTPSCSRCHAVPVEAHGPVVQMQPRWPRSKLSGSPAARIAEVQFLLRPTDEHGNDLPPMITPDEARDLLNTSGGWS